MRMQQQLTLAGGNRHAEPVARRGEKGKCRLHTRPGTGVERPNLRKVLAVAGRQFAVSRKHAQLPY
jgi:hypothetical protein